MSKNTSAKAQRKKREPAVISPELDQKYTDIAQSIKSDYIDKYFFLNDSDQGAAQHEDFRMLTSVRYDPNIQTEDSESSCFFLFDEHLQRLQFQLKFFNWNFSLPKDLFLSKLQEIVQQVKGINPSDTTAAYKLRVTITREGDVEIGASKATPRPNLLEGLGIEVVDPFTFISEPVTPLRYNIYLDTQPLPISVFTSFKTTNRAHYNDARKRVLNDPDNYSIKQDVLLHNSVGQIVECSISNVAIRKVEKDDNGQLVEKWITPQLSSGCLCGVVRQMLISKEFVEEAPVLVKDLKKGDEILYFNGVIGVARGIIC